MQVQVLSGAPAAEPLHAAPNHEGASLYSLQLKNLFGHDLTIQNMVGCYSRVSNNAMIYRYNPISMELSCVK